MTSLLYWSSRVASHRISHTSSVPSTMTSDTSLRVASMLSFVDPEPHDQEAPHKLGSTVGESMSNALSLSLTERHSMLKPNVTPPLSF